MKKISVCLTLLLTAALMFAFAAQTAAAYDEEAVRQVEEEIREQRDYGLESRMTIGIVFSSDITGDEAEAVLDRMFASLGYTPEETEAFKNAEFRSGDLDFTLDRSWTWTQTQYPDLDPYNGIHVNIECKTDELARDVLLFARNEELVTHAGIGEVLFPEDDPSDPVIGDANGDGTVNAKDYVLLKRHILGTALLSEETLDLMDVDGNGSVNAKDYLVLKRNILGN